MAEPCPSEAPDVVPAECPGVPQPPSTHPAPSAAAAETVLADGESPTDAAIPDRLDRYRIVRVLGRGGMGCVYLGHDEELNRPVAVKVPRAGLLSSPAMTESFLNEARTLASLEEAGVVPVYDVGRTPEGGCYVVSRFVDGGSLQDRLAGGRPSRRESAEIVASVAEALQAAHRKGFVHRDVKPSNILLDASGRALVADFGLAVHEHQQRQRAGETAGTPAYMSPEQVRGHAQHLDGRTDVWSLGVVLYELLTGRRPFSGDTHAELFDEILNREPRPLRIIDDSIPADLERIVLRCLRKSPADRYLTAQDLARDLRRWMHPSRRRNLVLAAAATLFAVAAVAVLWRQIMAPDGPPTGAVPVTGSASTSSAEVELARLLAELKGTLRDIEQTEGGPAVAARSETPAEQPAQTTVPETSVEMVPLPAGFQELESKLRAAREAGDEEAEEGLLLDGTNKLIELGHFSIAERLARRMVELAGNDPGDVPIAYGQLGLAQYRQGDFDGAIASYERALDVFRPIYARLEKLPETEQIREFLSRMARLTGLTLMRIGNVRKAEKKYQLAAEAYDEARRLYEKHQRKSELITLLLNMGGMESQRGNYTAANDALTRGVEIARELGDSQSEAEFLVNLGNNHSRQHEEESALECYAQAAALLSDDSPYLLRSALLVNWATSLLEAGRHTEARRRLEELRSIARPDDKDAQRVLEFLPALRKMDAL